MSYTTNHLHVTVGGTAPALEIWQFGMRFAPTALNLDPFGEGIADVDMAALEDAVDGLFSDTVDGLHNFIADDVAATWVKVAKIKTDGHYDGDALLRTFTTPKVGGSTSRVALQTSVCVSLRTDVRRGHGTHGRLYLPDIYWTRTQNEQGTTTSQQNAVLNAMNTFLNSVDSALGTAPAHDWSLSNFSKLGAGVTRPVTRILVGSMLDTISSRRGKPKENYVEMSYGS